MKLTKFSDIPFDRIYLLNLDCNPDKYHFAEQELLSIGLKPTRISGYNVLENQITSPLCDKPGGIGSMISCWMILQDAVAHGYERIAVFEDDIILHPNFTQLEKDFFEELPEDWELIWAGWDDRDKQKYNISPNVCTPLKPYGGQALIYNGIKAIHTCFENSKRVGYYDLILEGLVKNQIKCYLPNESLFDQRRHLSDIYPETRQNYLEDWYVSQDNKYKK